MDIDQYLAMCEQMGWEPEEDRLPQDVSTLSLEAQQAILLLESLPDLWDGMAGMWLGKDYSGLGIIMDIYEMYDRKTVFEFLKLAENELGTYYEQKRKEQENKNKAKRAM